jgi:hypothetical protein
VDNKPLFQVLMTVFVAAETALATVQTGARGLTQEGETDLIKRIARQRASSDHHLERMIVTREDGEAVWAEPRLDQAAWAVMRPVRSAFQFHGSRRSS